MELGQGHHVGSGPNYGFDYSSGLPFYSFSHGSQNVFRSVIARDNLIRPTPSSSNPLARAIELRDVEKAIVEDNLIEVVRNPEVDIDISRPVHFFNNSFFSGTPIEAATGPNTAKLPSTLHKSVEEALLLSI